MKRTLLCSSLFALLGLLGSGGCGAASFEPSFKKPLAPTEINVGKQIVAAKARTERPVAVGITTNPSKLCAWDLSAGMLWERPIDAKSNPLVVGNAIVIQERDGIVVRDLATGALRVVVDDEGKLIGADGIDNTIVVAIAYDDETARSKVVLVEGDSVRWRQTLNLAIGAPALLGDRVLVPWASQRLSVLAAQDGLEMARWNFTNMVVGHALVDRGRVFIGEHGLMRVKEDLPDHRDGPVALYAPIKRSLPGRPALMRDVSKPVPGPDSATNKLQVDWRVGLENEGASAENDQLILRYYRLVFGLSASSDDVRWLRMFDQDVIGTAIEPGGTWLADAAGNLSFLDLTGATRFERALGKSLRSISLRAAGYVPTSLTAAAPQPSLHDQLLAAAHLADERLSPARAYAIDRLAMLPEERVTAELLALCTDAASPEPVANSACIRLGTRENGATDVITALRGRASFLEGAAAPPVGALAQAAGRMKLKQAAPLLVSQAEDPHTKSADLVAVFQALGTLDHRPAVSVIERFVRLHHAEPAGSELGPALYAALSVLGDLRAQSARTTLEEVTMDGLTSEAVRKKARETLGVIDSPPVVAKVETPEIKAKAGVETKQPSAVEAAPRPYSLDAAAVEVTIAPLRKTLVGCLTSDPGKLRQARISMVVAGDGSVEGMFVTPTSLQSCMDPVLRSAKFPATRLGRQRVTQTIEAEANEPVVAKPAASTPAEKTAAQPQKQTLKPGAKAPPATVNTVSPIAKPVSPVVKLPTKATAKREEAP